MKKIILIILPLLCSCAYYNTFFVYYNTFYNAEVAYEKAIKIIEEARIEEDGEIDKGSESAMKTQLEIAINKSKLVLERFPDSKYIDDAIYLIAQSSFLKGDVAVAENYFKKLLDKFPDSKFYSLAEISLIYTYLRMGKIELARIEVDKLEIEKIINKQELFLIYNILAEISFEESKVEDVYLNYNKALDIAPSKSKKISIYNKLILFSEKNKNFLNASNYLYALADFASDKMELLVDSKMKWIRYQRDLGAYESIITEIQKMINDDTFNKEKRKLEVELGKVYMDSREWELAKNIFESIIEEDSRNIKREKSEAYFQLGYIALMNDFNLDIAKEYFENSNKEMSSSYYGREAKVYLNKITRYSTLDDLYTKNKKNPNQELEINEEDFTYINDKIDNTNEQTDETSRDDIDFNISEKLGGMNFASKETEIISSNDLRTSNDIGTEPDSILFAIGEMLLYDFNHIDLSLEKLQELTKTYSDSKYAPQSLYVLSHYQPEKKWIEVLENDYPNSIYLQEDNLDLDSLNNSTLQANRDYAWSLSKISYDSSYTAFNNVYKNYNDTLSAYIMAFISDYYLNNLDNVIQGYQYYINNYPEHHFSENAKNRLQIIESELQSQKLNSEQAINYKNTINFFKNEKNVDSTLILLDEIIKAGKSNYKFAAKTLKSTLEEYNELYKQLNEETNVIATLDSTFEDSVLINESDKINEGIIDSLTFELANLFNYNLEFFDSAKFYYKDIINNYINSKYRSYALDALSKVSEEKKWGTMLYKDFPKYVSTEEKKQNSSYYLDAMQENFISDNEEKIRYFEKYLEYFIIEEDSSVSKQDSLVIANDSLSLQLDSLKIPTIDSSNVKLIK